MVNCIWKHVQIVVTISYKHMQLDNLQENSILYYQKALMTSKTFFLYFTVFVATSVSFVINIPCDKDLQSSPEKCLRL